MSSAALTAFENMPTNALTQANNIATLYESSAVYRVLFNDDLFEVVVRSLLYRGTCDRASVARLARTSSQFTYAAMRFLWEKMTSLVPLFKTIPGLRWSIHIERDTQLWHVHAPTSDPASLVLDTSAFQRCATFIKDFAWETNEDVTPSTLIFFAKALEGSVSFWMTNIHVFKWHEHRHVPTLPPPCIFGAPTLKDISITASDIEQPMLLRILEDLPVLCPELERVVIKHPTRRQNCTHITYSPDIFPACNQFFYDMLNGPSGSSTLRHLTTCITLTWDDVFLLAQMPRLETLDATVCAPPEYPEPPLPEGAFQSLIHLKLELFELDDLMDRLLGGIDCPGLESLDVEVTETPPKEPQIRRFFERVALGTFRDGLERLRFEVWWHILPDEWDECVPGISMSMRTLGPLLQLPSLASLSLMVPRICLRYPDDFRELSLAWPQLRKISILQFSNAVSPADVDGLCAFAALSPNLKSIAFDVNGDFIPSPPYYSPEDMPLRSASVRKVTCCVYRQLSQDEVLAYLKFIFPNAVVKPTLESDRRVRRWREWDDE